MTNQRKKEYAIFIGICTLFLMMLPKVCAQTNPKTVITAEKAATLRTDLIKYSKDFLGCPYLRGSTGPATYDCSGYVFSMYREGIGIQIPRMAANIYKKAEKIKDEEREIGDLVFFKTTDDNSISHVGIFLGNDEFIHCASDGKETGVIISKLNSGYWKTHYFASGRYIPSSKTQNVTNKK